MKKDCLKGNSFVYVCHESHFIEAPNNTWWIDSGTTIHVANVMQGFLNLRKPEANKEFIYSGNQMSSKVEGVGTFRLVLKSGFYLDLKDTFYIPSFSRNLVSVTRLEPLGLSLYLKT